MADYKKMYQALCRAQLEAIEKLKELENILINAQVEMEEIYVDTEADVAFVITMKNPKCEAANHKSPDAT